VNDTLSPRSAPLPEELETPFAEFWKAYPSRGGHTNPKKAARVSYLRAVLAGADPTELTHQAAAYADWCKIRGVNRSGLVAMAATWLNQDRWEGDYSIGWHLLKDARTPEERQAMEVRLEEWERKLK